MRVLMVQGTASNAGKSVVVAGLCRLARRRGIRVAPFKSQNMSLNAAATREGLEIGRAQALQAEAAGLEATVWMNPILLKPEGELKSQIVLLGRALARADFRTYGDYREQCVRAIDQSLDELRKDTDLLIVEGAGSPAEINLMERDLANMFVARRTSAEVLLVGDIDRGGVFASFVGTLALLDEFDRARVTGFLINRFRGDVSLLEPGLDMLRERTGLPTVGVIPFLPDLALPEEDGQSVVVQNRSLADQEGKATVLVVRLPRLSNHDEFLCLERDSRIDLRFVDDPAALAQADVVILPGSKSTCADLSWLRANGLAEAIVRYSAGGGRLFGICGGFQMLGERIHDPEGVETSCGAMPGLGLLPVETTFQKEKVVRPVNVVRRGEEHWPLSGPAATTPIAGYEIHAGCVRPTEGSSGRRLFEIVPEGVVESERASEPSRMINDSPAASAEHASVELDGFALDSVAGTLVHGLFDHPVMVERLLGLDVARAAVAGDERGPNDVALNALADVLEAHLEPAWIAHWFAPAAPAES